MTGSTQLVRRVLAHRRGGSGPEGARARDNARGVDVGTMSAMWSLRFLKEGADVADGRVITVLGS